MNTVFLTDVFLLCAYTDVVLVVLSDDGGSVLVIGTPDDIATVTGKAEAALMSVAPFDVADLKHPDAVLDQFASNASLAAIRLTMPF